MSNQPPQGPFSPSDGPSAHDPQAPGGPPHGAQPGPAQPPAYGQQPPPYPQQPQQPPPYPQQPQQPQQPPAYGQPSYGQPTYGQQPSYGQPPSGPYGPGQPGQPPQGPGGPQLEYLSGGSNPNRKRRGLIVGGAAVASVLVLGGVSFGAYSYLSGGGDQPSNALPSSAVGYVRVDLDPSAGQKVDMLRLLRSVPDFEESTGISSDKADLRRLLIEEMLPSTGCDLTYEDDFEPWVGDRAGFAGVPVGDTVAPVISIQVKDEAAAGDTADALEQCATEESGDEDATGYDFVGDYMIVTEEQHLADVVDQTEESSLADNDTFTSDMDELGEQGVLSYWLDVDALRELPAAAQSLDQSGAAELSEGLHSSYGALRAGDNYIELLLSARADEELSDARTPVAELPESTMVAASFSGGGEAVNSYWNSFLESMDATTGGYAEDELDSLEQGTGLRFPDDLVTLLGENLTFTMSPDGLDQETLESGDLTRLNFGARFVTDAERLQSILTSVEQLAADAGSPIDLITQETDDGLVIASNEEYAGQIAEGGSLGDSDTFQTAVPNAEDTLGVLYVDLNKLRDVAEQFGEDPDVAEAMRYLEPFEAAGFSVVQNDGTVDSVLRLTFD